MLVARMNLEKTFIDAVYSDAGFHRHVYEVTYEDLQRDATLVLRDLFIFLEVRNNLENAAEGHSTAGKAVGVQGGGGPKGGGWVKRTSEDLKDVLDNFGELR